jgi:hypothetical protein
VNGDRMLTSAEYESRIRAEGFADGYALGLLASVPKKPVKYGTLSTIVGAAALLWDALRAKR